MASLTGETKERDDVKKFLRDHNLENYYQSIVDEGYDTLDDLRNIELDDLLDIGLKKGHAKRLLRKINEQSTNDGPQQNPSEPVRAPNTVNMTTDPNTPPTPHHQPLLLAPAAQNVDDDDLLPIAEAVPMSRGLNNLSSFNPAVPSVDPQLLEKEMRAQMERDYESKAAEERAVFLEEHAQKEAAVVKEAENQRDAAKKELALLKESLANQAKGESKESSSSSSLSPEGALRVQPGLNSLSKAVEEAKRKGIGCLLLKRGMHDEKGEYVRIDFALKVFGESKDDVKIRAGLYIKGKKEEDVFFTDLTVTGANGHGVVGNRGAAMHLKNVCVEKCGRNGVVVYSTTRNTMTDCNVNNNEWSGVRVRYGGRMVIDGSETTIHHNVTGGDSDWHGLDADSSSSIHLKSLKKESISTNNGGGGNCGCIDGGTIKTI